MINQPVLARSFLTLSHPRLADLLVAEEIRIDNSSIVESDFGTIRSWSELDGSTVEMHDSIGKGICKRVEQFSAMKIVVRSTEFALAHLSQWGGCEYAPVVPLAQLSRARAHADPSKRLLETKLLENRVGVRA